MKVSFFNTKVRNRFYGFFTVVSTIVGVFSFFVDIPSEGKTPVAVVTGIILVLAYLEIWRQLNQLTEVRLNIDGAEVVVKRGNIFDQSGLKVIAFNEYFDTVVSDGLISEKSINGQFILREFQGDVTTLDDFFASYNFEESDKLEIDKTKVLGKNQRFRLGTTMIYGDYIITAFSRFDDKNRAHLLMSDYLDFLLHFWDQVNQVYSMRDVSVPVLGSGITRIKGHDGIEMQELLKIMIWTYRISESRVKHPAKLHIVIDPSRFDRIDLSEVESTRYGL